MGERDSVGDVFVSYARADGEFVTRLQSSLEVRGRRAWIDWQDIPPTAEWMGEIRRAIDAADAVVFVLSPDSASSSVCAQELDHATATNKRIIPMLVRPVEPSVAPGDLAALNWIIATDGKFDRASDVLVEALDTDLDRVRAHSRLLVRTGEWNDKSEDRALLLRGSELTDAEAMIGIDSDPRATPEQARFVVASRQAAGNRQRTVIGAVTAALVLAASLGVLAWAQRGQAIEQRDRAEHEARVAQSRELALASVGELAIDPETSLLLSLEAVGIERTPQAQEALRKALGASHVRSAIAAHEGPALDVDVSAEGSRWVTGGSDGLIKVWAADMDEPSLTIDSKGGQIIDVQFSPDGNRILSVDDEQNVRLWDAKDGSRQQAWRGRNAAISPIGDLLVLVTMDRSAVSYSIPDGRRLATSKWAGPVGPSSSISDREVDVEGGGVRFDVDGDRVLTASASTAWVWEPRTGKQLGGVTGTSPIFALDISPDGDQAVTGRGAGDEPPSGEVWSADSGKVEYHFDSPGTAYRVAEFSPDGGTLMVGGEDMVTLLLDSRTGREEAEFTGHVRGVQDGEFSADGTLAVTVSRDGVGRVMTIPGGDEIGFLPGHDGVVRAAAFTPDGGTALTTADDGILRKWSVQAGGFLPLSDPPGLSDTSFLGANLQALSPDGSRVVTAETDGTAKVWNTTTGDLSRSLDLGEGSVVLVMFDPDGDRLLTATSEGQAILWAWPKLEEVARFHTDAPIALAGFSENESFFVLTENLWTDYVTPVITVRRSKDGLGLAAPAAEWSKDAAYAAAISPEGDRVVFLTGPSLVVDDVSSGTTTLLGKYGYFGPLEMASDGRSVLMPARKGAAILDVETGEEIASIEGGGGETSSAFFSPDEQQIVTAHGDGTAAVWNVATGDQVLELGGHVGPVTWATFSPDGALIETEADAVRLWDAATGALLATINVPGLVTDVEFMPDEPAVAITDVNGRTSIFRCEVCESYDELISLARDRVTRDLSAEERDRFGL